MNNWNLFHSTIWIDKYNIKFIESMYENNYDNNLYILESLNKNSVSLFH